MFVFIYLAAYPAICIFYGVLSFNIWQCLVVPYMKTVVPVTLCMQEETSAMRKEIQDLRTNARIFQLSKCTACTFTLDLPAVHFLCMHSFHQRCLGDNEKECPACAPQYRSLLDMKKNLEENAKDHDKFFQQLKSSSDGFSVVAGYFGKGVVSKTSNGPPAELRRSSLHPSGF